MAFLLSGFRELDRSHDQICRASSDSLHSVAEPNGLRLESDAAATSISGWGPTRHNKSTPGIVLYGWPLSPTTIDSAPSDGDSDRRALTANDLSDYIARNGFEAVERLEGSFVVVACLAGSERPDNSSDTRIDCYRSRTGGRTAYWTCTSEGFAVSDSAYRVARNRPEPLREDPAWLAEFFMLSSRWSASLSPFEGVRELLPGEHLTIAGGSARIRRKPLELSLEDPPRSIPEWVAALDRRLYRAVADSLPAGGPTAIMLSGGMDSGPAAAIAGEIAKRRGQPVHAVSWRIRGFPACDEWHWISMLADHLGVPLLEIDAENHMAFSRLDPSQVDDDSPLYNAFRPLILTCYENARQLGCEVLLNAASGDDLYPHPNRALVDDIVRADLRSATRRLGAIFRHYGPRRLHRATEIRGLARALLPRPSRGRRTARAWLSESAVRHLRPLDPWPPECSRSRHPDFARQLFGVMASGGIAREFRFSQRFGVDRRDPYLDPDLRRLMLQMPHALIWREGTSKWIAREAMKGRMPEAFRTKPRTGLLNAFFNHGFDRHRDEIRTLLLDQKDLWAPWVKPDYLKATLDGEVSEDRPRLVAGACIGYVLWKNRIKPG